MRVEQNGPEACEVATNEGFVLVRVAVRAVGDIENASIVSRYRIGGFVGREIAWPSKRPLETTLAFRIPREHFRERERLTLEVLRTDGPAGRETLWAKRYETLWIDEIPEIEPVPDPSVPPA